MQPHQAVFHHAGARVAFNQQIERIGNNLAEATQEILTGSLALSGHCRRMLGISGLELRPQQSLESPENSHPDSPSNSS
jgi:hypothetical protein